MSQLAQNSLLWSGWLASKVPGSSCCLLSSTGFISIVHHSWTVKYDLWLTLRSLCLCGKHSPEPCPQSLHLPFTEGPYHTQLTLHFLCQDPSSIWNLRLIFSRDPNPLPLFPDAQFLVSPPQDQNVSSHHVSVGTVWGLVLGGDVRVERLHWKILIISARHFRVAFKHCVKMRENKISHGVRLKMSQGK